MKLAADTAAGTTDDAPAFVSSRSKKKRRGKSKDKAAAEQSEKAKAEAEAEDAEKKGRRQRATWGGLHEDKSAWTGPAARSFERLVSQRLKLREGGELSHCREEVLLLYRLHKEILSRYWRLEQEDAFQAEHEQEPLDYQWWAQGMPLRQA